ncbi:hypothetical protein AAL_08359 [Moelleriella libera RCEF 2490]|uniref:Rhodopsin domain-containing protein n=1 Tax=Moelleriella libera RCEF 2490 TaxID=1081109 RepID=A0A162I1W9_9HYPO|nr:hypothetical protein AAL_08359 [Moelleriella libera RCEF 2490]
MDSFYHDIKDLTPPPAAVNNSHKVYSDAIAIIVLGAVASMAVIARLMQRIASRTLGLDDYIIVPTAAVFIAWTSTAAWFILNSGIGKPLGEVTYGEFIISYKGIFVAAWMYPIMSALIRTSILLFYQRLFAKANQWISVAIWTLLGLQLAYVITFEIIPGFACSPIQDGWEPIRRLTSCTDFYIDGTIALYGVSLAFDIIILILPLRPIWNLQISTKKKLSISAILLLGSCACIAAAYKLGIFADNSHAETPKDSKCKE